MYWTDGLGGKGSKHQARLNLPKQPKLDEQEITYRQLPTPTLADLLNPAPANEEALFTPPDLYSMDKLSDPLEDKEEPITIIWDGSRLDIEEYVDLRNINLLNCYDEGLDAKTVLFS
ncbi:hypothetical protein V5O48_014056 [Marasmius crinis-equi]|uniref:Uncharacterized protein n=1 Tax=Marasmius crinis-equi TaxID=585013 RepID=A0ABR3EYS5_9AGAR